MLEFGKSENNSELCVFVCACERARVYVCLHARARPPSLQNELGFKSRELPGNRGCFDSDRHPCPSWCSDKR